MTSAYDLLRQRCGLSQQEAADFHQARLDTVKSWCSGRRAAPDGAIDELQQLYGRIRQMASQLALSARNRPAPPGEETILTIPAPRTAEDAKQVGWPALGACLAAAGLAIAELPRGMPVELVDHSDFDSWDRRI